MPDNLGSWFGPAISTVINPLKDIFFKHALYCFNTGKYVRDHQSATRILNGKREGVQGEIDAGIPNGLIETREATYWLERANEAISNEEKNHQRYDDRCRIFACCSLNCWENYKISKRAAQELLAVNEWARSIPSNATVKRPPLSVIDIPVQSAQLPRHDDIPLDAQQHIKDDPVGIFGLCGPDRDENTYLLKRINNLFVGDSSYFVIFVTASRECSVEKIQSQIIHRLDIRHDDDQATRTTKISELLGTRSFVVLVDDLCEKLDLPAVGIPYPLGVLGQVKRKVVITSRSEDICNLMDVKVPIEVPCLEEDEACQLFQQNVGQDNLYEDPHIGALATELVKELKGLTSDLIHIGKVMRRKKDASQWENIIHAVKETNLRKDDPLCLTGKIVKDLKDATNNLLARSKDINLSIETAERKGRTSTNEVKGWLEKVATINSAAHVIFNDYELNKDVTVEAAEKLSEVQECLRACPDIVAVETVPPPAQEIPGSSMSSKNRNLQRALQFIEDDPVGMIGIWGPGGVGKTYLLNSINNSIAVAEGMSFSIIFVTASRGCSVEKIQGDFLTKLGMEKDGNVEFRGQKIYNFLMNRSFLVLLDDLWEQIDLQAVGVPYPLGTVNQLKRKVVLTTRSRKVCGKMEVRKEIKVACLREDEAWQLFQEKVSQETLFSNPRIEALARELVNELKGLPLALIVVGRAMYKIIDPIEWEYAIQHMQQSCCDKDNPLSMENVFRQLKFSYDSLRNDTLRHCFLTCALWPEDWEIIKADLAQCWIGLGLVDGVDIRSSYTRAYSLIGDLRDACLLENWGNWYGLVKVHDVIRDMALWISCGCGENNNKWFVHAKVDTEENFGIPWSSAEYISLMLNEMRKLPPFGLDHCPMKLRMLCLQNNYFDGSIAETIKNFTSLTYLDLRTNLLKDIPEALCSLVNLEYLDLSHNLELYQLPYCFRDLIKLKFLYLLCTDIRRIPEEVISNLKALQVIELRTWRAHHGGSVNYIPTIFQELGTLNQLKAVGIEADGFTEYESLRDAANLPIRSLILGSLRDTQPFCLSDILSVGFARRTLYDLEIIQSNMEQIIVRQEPNYRFGTLSKLSLWFLLNLKEITWAGRSPASVFPRLTCLDVNSCSKLEHLSWVMYLPCLEQLEARFCNNMKEAFPRTGHDGEIMSMDQGSSRASESTFPCLKHLRLSDNSKLVSICGPDVTFPYLEQLVLTKSPELIRLPFQTHSLPLKLQKLRFDDVGFWDRLQCEESVKSFLQPALKFGYETEGLFGW